MRKLPAIPIPAGLLAMIAWWPAFAGDLAADQGQQVEASIANNPADGMVAEPDLTGTWKYEKSAVIGGAQMFTSIDANGTCTQVVKGRAFGMTKWAVYGCTWVVENGDLEITIVTAPDQPGATGKTIVFSILGADARRLQLASDGEQLEWNAVSSLPVEFQEKLESAQPGGEPTAPRDAEREPGEEENADTDVVERN